VCNVMFCKYNIAQRRCQACMYDDTSQPTITQAINHFLRSVTMIQLVQFKEDMVAEQDTPGSDKLLRWP